MSLDKLTQQLKHMAGKHPQKTHDPHKGGGGSSQAIHPITQGDHKSMEDAATKGGWKVRESRPDYGIMTGWHPVGKNKAVALRAVGTSASIMVAPMEDGTVYPDKREVNTIRDIVALPSLSEVKSSIESNSWQDAKFGISNEYAEQARPGYASMDVAIRQQNRLARKPMNRR